MLLLLLLLLQVVLDEAGCICFGAVRFPRKTLTRVHASSDKKPHTLDTLWFCVEKEARTHKVMRALSSFVVLFSPSCSCSNSHLAPSA